MRKALRNIWQSEFFRNVSTLISGTTFAQAFSVVIYIILSGIYSDEAFGVFGLYMNILAITIIFSTAKYELAILLPKDEREAVNVLGLSAFVSVLVSLLLLLLVLLFRHSVARWLGSPEIAHWLWFIPPSTLMVGLFQTFRNYSNREKRYRLIAGANISQSLSNSLTKLSWGWVASGALGLTIAGPEGLIYGALIGQLVGLLSFLVVHLRVNSEKWQWISLKEMYRLARHYILFPRFNMLQGVINNLSGALPVFVFSKFFGLGIAGYYTFGYMVVYRPVNLVANAFYQVIYQRFVSKLHGGASIREEAGFFIRRSLQVLVIPFILAGFFCMDLFDLLFDESKLEAGRYAQILIPWFFTVLIVMPLSFVPDLFKRQKTAMFIDGVKLLLRMAGLAVGVMSENVYIALAMFSGVSTLVNIYSLLWYIRLIRKNE